MPSNSTTSAMNYHLPFILVFCLIESNDWDKVDSVFLTDLEGQRTFQGLGAHVTASKGFNGMTNLHACARFNPPPQEVGRIIELCPDPQPPVHSRLCKAYPTARYGWHQHLKVCHGSPHKCLSQCKHD